MKENDYFLNYLSNPTFSYMDFQQVGLTTENTSLADKDKYKNLDFVKNNPLLQTDGKFDETKFNTAYDNALSQYNSLSKKATIDDIVKDATFFRDNIYAPEALRRKGGPEFTVEKFANPERLNVSFLTFNVWEEPKFTQAEIAQTQKIWDNKTQSWQDAPNDRGFFSNLFDKTRVLALWDFDADANGNPTTDPEKIVYKKGTKKLNENGTYYYEDLNGRDIYGREVLSKFDTLTVDGSKANKYDFFDSDSKDTSIGKTIVKNVFKVAPAFIPVVSPYYIGARVGLETVDLMSKLTKVFTGSDSPLSSEIEGLCASLSLGSSEHARETPWSWENILNMSGDVFTQLAEQRWLFEYAPMIFKQSKLGIDKKTQTKFLAEKEAERMELLKTLLEEGIRLKKITPAEQLTKAAEMKASAVSYARNALENELKSFSKFGEHLSKAYMTGVTVADAYGEAKQEGLNDLQASLFTLAYAAGEYGILNTSLGERILPELRMEKQRMKKIIQEISQMPEPNKLAPKEEKISFMKKIFTKTKSMLAGDYDKLKDVKGTQATFWNSIVANSLGEGVEEVSEEALADFTKSLYNGISWLTGSKTRLKPTWENGIENTFSDYALNFVGGAIGGGLGNAHVQYKQAKNIANLQFNPQEGETNAAWLEFVYLVREGKAQEMIDMANKMTLADRSVTLRKDPIKTEDGLQFQSIDEDADDGSQISANQDVQDRFSELVNTVDSLLDENLGKVSDDDFMDMMTLKDLRYYKLQNSAILSNYMLDFNSTVSQLVDVSMRINSLKTDTTPDGTHKELSGEELAELSKLESKKAELEKTRDAYLDGTIAKEEFIPEAIFEMNDEISKDYIPCNKIRYIEAIERKPISQITQTRLDELSKEWDEFAELDKKEKIHRVYKVWKHLQEKVSPVIANHEAAYFKSNNEANALEGIDSGAILQYIQDSDLDEQFTERSNEMVGIGKTTIKNRDVRLTLGLLQNAGLSTQEIEENLALPETLEEYAALQDTEKVEIAKALKKKSIGEVTQRDLVEYKKRQVYTALGKALTDQKNIPGIVKEIRKLKYLKIPHKLAIQEFFNKIDDYTAQQFGKGIKFTDLEDEVNDGGVLGYEGDQLKEAQRVYDSIRSAKSNYTHTLELLTYSPIDELLDGFQLSLGDKGTPASELLTQLHEMFDNEMNLGDLANFGYDGDVHESIQTLNNLITLLSSHINAARKQNPSINSVYTYNSTVNALTESELPEIDDETANYILHDLYKTKAILDYYQDLYNVNVGNKRQDHTKSAAKYYTNLYKSLKRIFTVNIPDDWEGKDEVIEALTESNNPTLFRLSSSNNIADFNLHLDEHKTAFGEFLNVFSALHKFLNNEHNKKKIENGELNQFINAQTVKLIDPNSTTINPTSIGVPDSKLIWTLATAAAIDPLAFYDGFVKTLGDDLMAIPAQEFAVHMAVAHILNPKAYEPFIKVYNESAKAELLELKAKYISEGKSEEDATRAILEKFEKEGVLINFDNFEDTDISAHKSLTSFLIEGIPGCGKSSATKSLIIRFLNTNGFSEYTKNIWYVAPSTKMAIKWAKEDGLSDEQCKKLCFSKEEYLKKIHKGYIAEKYDKDGNVIFEKEYFEKKDDGLYHYKDETINGSIETPSLVLIDECTRFSQQQQLISDKFLEESNITSVLFGDFDQICASGILDDGTVTHHFRNHRNNFIGAHIQGTSMRTGNTLKDYNNALIKARYYDLIKTLYDPQFNLKLKWTEDVEGNLYGDRVMESSDPDVNKQILKMLKTLGEDEKITYIGEKSGELYDYLVGLNNSGEFENKIKFTNSEGSQGAEGKYYIINFSPESKNDHDKLQSVNFIERFYTNVTRAIQGSLIVKKGDINLRSEQVPKPGKFDLTPELKKASSDERKEIIQSYLEGKEIPKIVPLKLKQTTIPEKTEEVVEVIQNKEAEEVVNARGARIIDDETLRLLNEGSSGEEETASLKSTHVLNKRTLQLDNSDPNALNVFLHTCVGLETGLMYDENTGKYYLSEDGKRIDNINGLFKTTAGGIEIDVDNSLLDPKSAIAKLRKAQSILIHGTSKEEIILNLINNNILEPGEYDIRFGYKCAGITDSADSKLKKNLEEVIGDELSPVKTSSQKTISAIIYKKETNKKGQLVGKPILDISIAKLPHPTSLALSVDENDNPVFGDIAALAKKAKNDAVATGNGDANKIRYNEVNFFEKLLEKSSDPRAKFFKLLCAFWTDSNSLSIPTKGGGKKILNSIWIPFEDKDGNPLILGKIASLTGPIITNTERGSAYVDDEYRYKPRPINVDDLENLYPGRQISDIVSLTSTNSKSKYFAPGKPFILVSDDPETLDTKLMLERYIYQREHPEAPLTISAFLISTPKVQIEDYLNNFFKYRRGEKKDGEDKTHFGNTLTTFRLCQVLADNNFLDELKSIFEGKELSSDFEMYYNLLKKMTKVLTELEQNTSQKEFLEILTSPLGKNEQLKRASLHKNLSGKQTTMHLLSSVRNNILTLLYKLLTLHHTGTESLEITDDSVLKRIEFLKDLIKKDKEKGGLGWDGIYLRLPLEKDNTQNIVVTEGSSSLDFGICRPDKIKIEGITGRSDVDITPCLIGGKIDSSALSLDLAPILEYMSERKQKRNEMSIDNQNNKRFDLYTIPSLRYGKEVKEVKKDDEVEEEPSEEPKEKPKKDVEEEPVVTGGGGATVERKAAPKKNLVMKASGFILDEAPDSARSNIETAINSVFSSLNKESKEALFNDLMEKLNENYIVFVEGNKIYLIMRRNRTNIDFTGLYNGNVIVGVMHDVAMMFQVLNSDREFETVNDIREILKLFGGYENLEQYLTENGQYDERLLAQYKNAEKPRKEERLDEVKLFDSAELAENIFNELSMNKDNRMIKAVFTLLFKVPGILSEDATVDNIQKAIEELILNTDSNKAILTGLSKRIKTASMKPDQAKSLKTLSDLVKELYKPYEDQDECKPPF